MAFQALIQLFQASSQPIQAPNWLSGLTSALLDLNSAQRDGRTDGQTNGRMKVPLCSTGLRPLRGRCPASPHSNSQSLKAGQRVSLTTYCPWATCFFMISFFYLTAPSQPSATGLMCIRPCFEIPSRSLSKSTLKILNRSPKGNMWSAIPVALLCMIVNRSE